MSTSKTPDVAPDFEDGDKPNNMGAKILSHETLSADGKRPHSGWYRGENTNKAAQDWQLTDAGGVRKWIVKGWEPEAAFIDRNTKVTAFGSCFAANISSWLGKRNYRVSSTDTEAQDAYVVSIGEGMVNSFVIRQQFEWAWENKVFETPLWHGYQAEDFGYDPHVQKVTKDLFDTTDVFVLTLGLSEIWYDEVSGGVFWRTIPKDVYDPTRHKFRVSTVQENQENLKAIYALIRKHRPDAKIVMTLSPIPLSATFRETSCISANSVSKAVLRVAIDELMRDVGDEGVLHYWPSYELVTEAFRAPFKPDRHHLPRDVLTFIMMLFEEVYCIDEGDRFSINEQWVRAASDSKILPPIFKRLLDKGKVDRLKEITESRTLSEDDQTNRAMLRTLHAIIEDWPKNHPEE